MKKAMWMMAALAALGSAMAVGQTKVPNWITGVPDADTALYYVGVSVPSTNERYARESALEDARDRFAMICDDVIKSIMSVMYSNALGIDVTLDGDYRVIYANTTDKPYPAVAYAIKKETYQQFTTASRRLLKEKDVFTEIYNDETGLRTYKVYVLMTVDTNAINKALAAWIQNGTNELKDQKNMTLSPKDKQDLANLVHLLGGSFSFADWVNE